jgi:hypothetical protein
MLVEKLPWKFPSRLLPSKYAAKHFAAKEKNIFSGSPWASCLRSSVLSYREPAYQYRTVRILDKKDVLIRISSRKDSVGKEQFACGQEEADREKDTNSKHNFAVTDPSIR